MERKCHIFDSKIQAAVDPPPSYDAATGTGGSNGATMRFAPEGDHGANAGLKAARDFLEPVKRPSKHLPKAPSPFPHSLHQSLTLPQKSSLG